MEESRFHRYELPDGWVVLAGRTDEDNDALSLKVAGPVSGAAHLHLLVRVIRR